MTTCIASYVEAEKFYKKGLNVSVALRVWTILVRIAEFKK